MSRLVNPACRKLCSYRSIFMARSHSETEPQAERGGGTRWSNRGWDELRDRDRQDKRVNQTEIGEAEASSDISSRYRPAEPDTNSCRLPGRVSW